MQSLRITRFFSFLSGLTLCVALLGAANGGAQAPELKTPKLLLELPAICPTPDGLAMDDEGNIIVACPNYGDPSHPAVLMKIDKKNQCRLYAKVPPHPETGVACPMGIAFGPKGDLFICDNQGWAKPNDLGRILRLKVAKSGMPRWSVVAEGMSHPNGVRVHNNQIYVTQSMLPKVKGDRLVSAVYRFELDDRDVKVNNTLEDKNLLVSFETKNMECQYGMDGLVFDSKGALFVGNFGDGALHKITFDGQGKPASNTIFAQDVKVMRTTDGICIDRKDNIYVADFSENAICVVSPDGKIRRLAKSPDCDGSKGGLDQPGEPIVRGKELIVSNFDMVTGPDKVNTKHDAPFTMSVIDLTD